MRRHGKDFITFYKRATDVNPDERARAKLACQIALSAERLNAQSDISEALFPIAGRLLYWSKEVLLGLCTAHRASSRRSTTESEAYAGRLRHLPIEGDFQPIEAGDLVNPE